MSRSLTTDFLTEIGSTEVAPIFLFEGEFISGNLNIWTGYGDLTWNSETWTGAGTLFSISAIEESSETSAKGITVAITGIPSDMVALVLGDVKQNSIGRVYLGFLDSDGSVAADPVLLFEGRLDIPSIQEESDSATISITYESRLIDLQRTRESRYTNEDQQAEFPGDKAFEFVPNLQEIQINWGRNDSSGTSKPIAR